MNLSQLNNHKSLSTAIFLAFIVFVVYLPALQNGFVNWDDDLYVYENLNIQSINIKWIFSAEANPTWHPLTLLSLALDYVVWGSNPFGYHLTNSILHTLNTLLVFILIMRLIDIHKGISPSIGSSLNREKTFIAFTTALFFGIHPVNVETVVWVSERKGLLCAFFFLLSLIEYIKHSFADTKKGKVGRYLLCLIFFILALMSKPIAVSLPIVIVILDFYLFKQPKEKWNIKKVLIEKSPFFFLSVVSVLITIWVHRVNEVLLSRNMFLSFEAYPMDVRFLNAIQAYALYLLKMAFPFNLAPYYPLILDANFFTFGFVALFMIPIIITICCIMASERNSIFLAIWLYYIAMLLPVSSLVKVGGHSMAYRYAYLPSLAPFFLFSLVIIRLFSVKRFKIALGILLVLILIFYANKTVRQISLWHDSIVFWSYQIKLSPNSFAYNNRGIAFSKKGNYREAVKDYTSGIRLSSKDWDLYYNRGIAYGNLGDYKAAISDYTSAINLNPKDWNLYYNRGIAYGDLGDYEAAIEDYTVAIRLNPQDVRMYNNRATAAGILGDYQQAISDLQKAISLRPQDGRPYFNLGLIYLQKGDVELAKISMSKAADLGVQQAKAYDKLF